MNIISGNSNPKLALEVASELGEKINQIIKIQTDIEKRNNQVKEIFKKVYGKKVYEEKINKTKFSLFSDIRQRNTKKVKDEVK